MSRAIRRVFMSTLLAEVAAFAIVATLSPFPIIALVPLLAAEHGVRRGVAFFMGWVLGLAIAAGGIYAALHVLEVDLATDSGPATWTSWTKLVLGAALAVYAARTWMSRPRAGETATPPAWLASLDGAPTTKLASTGVAIAALNPKILLLAFGAAAAIVQAERSQSDSWVAVVAFVVIGAIGPLVPIVIATVAGVRSARLLATLRTWMERNNALIMAALFGAIGAKLVVDSLRALS